MFRIIQFTPPNKKTGHPGFIDLEWTANGLRTRWQGKPTPEIARLAHLAIEAQAEECPATPSRTSQD